MGTRKRKHYAEDLKEFKSDGRWAESSNQRRISATREKLEGYDTDNEKEERFAQAILPHLSLFRVEAPLLF